MYSCVYKFHTPMPRRRCSAWVPLHNKLLSSIKACSKSSEPPQEINPKTPSAPVTLSLKCVNAVHAEKHNVTLHPDLKALSYGQYITLLTVHFPTNSAVTLD